MKPKVILLIEDNLSDIELAKRALGRNHVSNELIVIEDGKEALDYLFGEGVFAGRNVGDLPALVLLDLKLPRVDGHEILKRIRGSELTHRLPVVILTSSKEERDVAESYDLGVNSYIQKPVDFEQFARAIVNLEMYWLVLNEPPPSVSCRAPKG